MADGELDVQVIKQYLLAVCSEVSSIIANRLPQLKVAQP